jgi:hypothetical protein
MRACGRADLRQSRHAGRWSLLWDSRRGHVTAVSRLRVGRSAGPWRAAAAAAAMGRVWRRRRIRGAFVVLRRRVGVEMQQLDADMRNCVRREARESPCTCIRLASVCKRGSGQAVEAPASGSCLPLPGAHPRAAGAQPAAAMRRQTAARVHTRTQTRIAGPHLRAAASAPRRGRPAALHRRAVVIARPKPRSGTLCCGARAPQRRQTQPRLVLSLRPPCALR